MGDSIEQEQSIGETSRKNRNIEVAAREPWPTNTFLYVPLKEQMVPFAQDCLSTFCLLRKARVPALTLQHARNAPEMSSTGCPPVLTLNNRVFCGFEEVADLLELRGLLSTEACTSSTIESFSLLCTETLGSIMKYFLFDEKSGATVYNSFISVYPWPLGLILYLKYRRRTVKMLQIQDCWSLSPEQVAHKFETTVKALSDKIENNKSAFLFGNEFTKADAQLYGHLYSILETSVPEYDTMRNILLKYKPLIDFVHNIDRDVNGLTLLSS